MKKKIFAVIAAMAIAATMSTGVFAVAPGGSDGSAAPAVAETKVEAEKPVELKTDGASLNAPAGAFAEGAKVKIETKVDAKPADAAKTETSISKVVAAKLNVAADSADAKVQVNTKISIDLYVNDVKANPNGSVTVTVAHDGKSNYAAYIGSDGKVELLKLTVNGSNASFDTTHFSDYYFVTISEKAASSVGTSATLEEAPSTTTPADDKNKPTGVALALAPVILSGAVVAVLKKKKN